MSGRPLVGLAALALALTAPSAVFAQASPSAGTSAARYDLLRREVGTISPDPDPGSGPGQASGPLPFLATRKTYSAAGHLTKVETGTLAAWQNENVAPAAWTGFALISQVDTTYDVMGRKVREEASGVSGGTIVTTGVTEYGYDLAGRLKCTAVRMNPDVWATQLGDKCVPGPAHAVHGPDRITRNSYTVHGEILKVERAVGTGLEQVYASYAYSPNGKPIGVTDANGNRAEMTWDGLDRQKRWIFPSKTIPGESNGSDYEEYGYDSNANRTSLRKRDGSILTYQYDALNRVSVKVVPERTGLTAAQTRDVYYEYDLRGLQTRARFDSLAGEGVTNAYDGFGLLTSSSSNMGGVARAVGNLYDLDGNRIRVVHPDTSFFTYEVDGLGRPIRIRENGGDPIVTFAYDGAGRRVSSGWAATTSYGYDAVGRLQSLSHDLVGASRDHVLGFTYNPASQIQSRSASNPAYAWSGGANAIRNYAANGLNQYTAAGPATFAHDLNGNLSSTANPSFGSTSYVYDVENRLVSASGAQAAELVYDPLGRLSQVSSVAGGIRRLVYDGDALVAEYEPGGYMVHRYIHGNDAGADDPLIWYDNWNGGWRRALLTDHQGSVIQVADMYGNPVATNSYDPWGIPGATPVGRFGYTGQTWVPELGLWYYKARFYSPTTGRFLQVDPVGYEEDVNLYVYAGNDPINLADVTGKAPNRAGATSYHDVIVGLRRHTFREIADSHIGNQHRYFYTSSYGWIDIRHFATAAADVLESRHYGMTERLLGFGLEFHQFLTESGNDYRSGFSSEDLSSNAAGIDFGVLYRGTPQRDLGVAFRKWAEANGGRRLTDSPTAALPATDPSERGGRGHGSGPASDNSTNEAAQGRSNDFCAKSQPLCEAGVPR